jgi:hypothetical protein
MGSLRAMLAPKPFRGDLIAAGAASLAVGLVLLDTRVQDDWAGGLRFAVLAAGAALLLTMAWLAPVEGASPRMYVSALLVAAEYATFAVRRGSAISAFLAAASAVVCLLAAWSWVFDPDSATPLEWLCAVSIIVLAYGAVVLRDHHKAHAVALIDVAGLTALLLAGIISIDVVSETIAGEGVRTPSAPWGWKLVLVAVGFGLVAYGAVDRERGPVWLGVAVLTAFVLLAGAGNVLWWPLILLVIGVAAIAAGLRPTTAAPPAPDLDRPEAPRPFDLPPDPVL